MRKILDKSKLRTFLKITVQCSSKLSRLYNINEDLRDSHGLKENKEKL
jgi:hypothetical protein